eukprot:6014530-Lingulodinium_polyedra.AAC.1
MGNSAGLPVGLVGQSRLRCDANSIKRLMAPPRQGVKRLLAPRNWGAQTFVDAEIREGPRGEKA